MEGFLNPFDIIVIAILLISGIVSWSKGFTTEALSLGAWAGAIIITLQGQPLIAPHARELIQPDFMASVISYALLGVVSLMLLKFLATVIGKKIKESHIGALDRGLGVLFGLLRGMLLICAVFLIVNTFVSPRHFPDWYQDSKSRPLVEYGASMMNALNPAKDDLDVEKTRENMKFLKNIFTSYPSSSRNEEGYDKESTDEMDELFRKKMDE